MAAGPAQLTIATYNVLADCYVKPEYYAGCDPSALDPTVRHPRLLSDLALLDVDVLCLQEVEYGLFERMRDKLGATHQGRWAHKDNGKKDGCATFVRSSLRVLASYVLSYDESREGLKRSGHVALATVIGAGRYGLSVVNTHLKWDSPETPSEKSYGLTQAKQLLEARRNAGLPTVICGDFNAEAGSAVLDAFADDGFVDAHPPTDLTCVANGRAQKIDYVLAERRMTAEPLPLRYACASVERPIPSSACPSDHLPLGLKVLVDW